MKEVRVSVQHKLYPRNFLDTKVSCYKNLESLNLDNGFAM